MPAVSQTIPLFFGSMPEAVRIALDEFGIDDLTPGDVIIVNDPYRVGTHVNDVCFIRPVFDGGRMLGAVTIRAHMLDWGGKAIGGFEVTKKDLYEDGLVLPPTLLFRAGQPVRSTFNLVLDNTRFGAIVLPDIQTIGTSLELGEQLLLETVNKYGYPATSGRSATRATPRPRPWAARCRPARRHLRGRGVARQRRPHRGRASPSSGSDHQARRPGRVRPERLVAGQQLRRSTAHGRTPRRRWPSP